MSHRKLSELRQRATKKLRAARQLYDEAKREGRDLRYDEQRRWDGLMDEHDGLHAEADELEKRLKQEAEDALREAGGSSWADRHREGGALTREDSYFDHCARRGWRTELDERVAEALGRGDRVEVFRAAVTGQPRNELEERALSGGSGAGGGFTVPEPVRAQIIDFARARSVAIRAGARIVPIESDTVYFPRVVADPDFGWYAENVQSTDVQPTYGRWTASPKTNRGIVRGSIELFQDSVASGSFESHLMGLFARRFALELDQAVVVGASTSGGPTGLMELGSTDGVNVIANRGSTGSAMGLINWKPLVDAYEQIGAANLNPDTQNAMGISAVMSPRSYAGFGNLRATDNQPMAKPPVIEDMAMYQTSSIPNTLSTGNGSELVVGDYSRLVIALRMEPQFRLLSERYADYGQFGLFGMMRADAIQEYRAAFTRVQHVGASTFA